jgi:hypothetical protein
LEFVEEHFDESEIDAHKQELLDYWHPDVAIPKDATLIELILIKSINQEKMQRSQEKRVIFFVKIS